MRPDELGIAAREAAPNRVSRFSRCETPVRVRAKYGGGADLTGAKLFGDLTGESRQNVRLAGTMRACVRARCLLPLGLGANGAGLTAGGIVVPGHPARPEHLSFDDITA
jgi:hypothetical protein